MQTPHPLTSLCLLLLVHGAAWVNATTVTTVWPRTSNLQRYSGCNGFKIHDTCSALHIPPFLDSMENGLDRLNSNECLSLLAFVRCTIYKMACRNAVSNDLIWKVPCQASCERAVAECRKSVHEERAWDHLRAEDCRFLPAGGCLDWTVRHRRRSYLPGGLLSELGGRRMACGPFAAEGRAASRTLHDQAAPFDVKEAAAVGGQCCQMSVSYRALYWAPLFKRALRRMMARLSFRSSPPHKKDPELRSRVFPVLCMPSDHAHRDPKFKGGARRYLGSNLMGIMISIRNIHSYFKRVIFNSLHR